jgi:hypothetical protein
MKVKFIVSVSALDRSYAAGESAEINDTLAKQWIASGHCRAVDGAPAQVATAGKDADAPPPQPEPVSRGKKKGQDKEGG